MPPAKRRNVERSVGPLHLDEIALIFTFLSFREAVLFEITSKSIQRSVQYADGLRSNIALTCHEEPLDSDDYEGTWDTHEHVSMRICVVEAMQRISKKCSNLKALSSHYYGDTQDAMIDFLSVRPKILQRLEYFDATFSSAIVKSFPVRTNLVYLSFHLKPADVPTIIDSPWLSNVRYLDASGCTAVPLLKHMPNLITLSMRHPTIDIPLVNALSLLPSLRALKLNLTARPNTAQLSDLGLGAPRLQSLQFYAEPRTELIVDQLEQTGIIDQAGWDAVYWRPQVTVFCGMMQRMSELIHLDIGFIQFGEELSTEYGVTDEPPPWSVFGSDPYDFKYGWKQLFRDY